MIIYDNIYEGGDIEIARHRNYLAVLEKLRFAKTEKQGFFLVSSARVFDLSLNRRYLETDKPNTQLDTFKFLAEAERRVMSYSNGHVFRVQDRISSHESLFRDMASFDGEPVLDTGFIRLLSEEAFSFLFVHYRMNIGARKCIHFCVPTEFEASTIWTYIRGLAPFSVGDISSFPMAVSPGCLFPSTLSQEYFYQGFLRENANSVKVELGKVLEGVQ